MPAQRQNRFLAPPGVEREQDEQRQVKASLGTPKRGAKEAGSFLAREPAGARLGRFWQFDRYGTGEPAVLVRVVDGCP